jgi:hypothetical protein
VGRIQRTADELNGLMREAHVLGLLVQVILDSKQLPFPLLGVKIYRELGVNPCTGGDRK